MRIPVPESLRNAYWSYQYDGYSYADYLNLLHSLVAPSGLQMEIKRLRLNVDLSNSVNYNSATLSYWSEDSDLGSAAPGGTYPTCSNGNDNYDLRLIRIGKSLDTNKKIVMITNGIHGWIESSSKILAYRFIYELFDKYEENWVQAFFKKYQLLIFPCINVYGNFKTADDANCSYEYENANAVNLNRNIFDYGEPSQDRLYEQCARLLQTEITAGQSMPFTISLDGNVTYFRNKDVKECLINDEWFGYDQPANDSDTTLTLNARSLNGTSAELHSVSDRVYNQGYKDFGRLHNKELMPFSEPESMIIRNVVKTYLADGYTIANGIDWHQYNGAKYITFVKNVVGNASYEYSGNQPSYAVNFNSQMVEAQNKAIGWVNDNWSYVNYPPSGSGLSPCYRKLLTEITAGETIDADNPKVIQLDGDVTPFQVEEEGANMKYIKIGNEYFPFATITDPNATELTLTGRAFYTGSFGSTAEAHSINDDVVWWGFPLEEQLWNPFVYLNDWMSIHAECNYLGGEIGDVYRRTNGIVNIADEENTPLMFIMYNNVVLAWIDTLCKDAFVEAKQKGSKSGIISFKGSKFY